jgi:hypothetical protein
MSIDTLRVGVLAFANYLYYFDLAGRCGEINAVARGAVC